ncbi:hypothetical protein [Desulfoluna sp.]|uniref:hypothetical protein n=1 Tax=Desulfoluna sp. TaxID=2045199 RepID=UPI00261FF47D|nr:hypothetical protein [Desulfoluna sp.]
MNYQFPVEDPYDALEVTEMDFSIDPSDQDVYVDFDSVRDKTFLDRIKFNLRIKDGKLQSPTKKYHKFIFSGHKGSGKSVELKRFHNSVNKQDCYLSVHIDIEQEMEVGGFQSEDLFVILIAKLMERIHDENIPFESESLSKIINEWTAETETKEELSKNYQLEASGEVSASSALPWFIQFKSSLKSIFSVSSKTSTTIRQKIKNNPLHLIAQFNDILSELRTTLKGHQKPKDILFIFDGTEKIAYDIYQKLFVKDSYIIRGIDSNIIFSVPINSYFEIKSSPAVEFFHIFYLPMVKLSEEGKPKLSEPLLSEVISKRIKVDKLISPVALDLCVKKSGGCIRQLIRIVNTALSMALGAQVTEDIAKKSIKKLGYDMKDLLTSDHLEILINKKYNTADSTVIELLLCLAVLKYNGKRGINPLLEGLINE